MNALIALCHFCEAHGPCPILCTQTLRDAKIENLVNSVNTAENNNCPGCNSIGTSLGMLSQDIESNANFLSTQTAVISDIVPLVKQAAVRSLSCEVSGNKDGSLVFFGDASRGHVLSYTFQIHDSQARGFFRLYSIVVLMKDKMFLLNVQPFLAENLQKISTELRNYSGDIHTAEQAKYSERAQRLNSGQASTQPPRSLIELTGQKNVFAYIHSHFAWILWMGSRYLTENITIGSASVPPWTSDEQDGFFFVHIDKDEWLLRKSVADDENLSHSSLRLCNGIFGKYFAAACYCVLIGVQVVLRGPPSKTQEPIKCLRRILPESMHNLIQFDKNEYVPASKCRILSVLPQVAVPQPSANVFRIDFVGVSNDVHVKWLGELPNKYPDLLTKILKSVNEKLLNDRVLNKQIRVLVEEWKNKVLCMQKIASNQDLVKIKKILGVQAQDQPLISYWSSFLTN